MDLINAVRRGRTQTVEQILARRALGEQIDVNINVNGETPLMLALKHQRDDIISLLLSTPDVDVNIPNAVGDTPFMMACLLDDSIVEKFLTVKRLEPNVQDFFGDTALMILISRGKTHLALKLLKNFDIRVDTRNDDGETAIDLMRNLIQE